MAQSCHWSNAASPQPLTLPQEIIPIPNQAEGNGPGNGLVPAAELLENLD